MDYLSFIENASFTDISLELSRLAQDENPKAIEDISFFLTHKINDTFGKHELPRLACRALIQKGTIGITKLASLLFEIDGFIYPTAIINSIWYASNGYLDPFHLGALPIPSPLDNEPSPDVVITANKAFHEIIIRCFRDKEKINSIIGFLYQQSCVFPDCEKLIESIFNVILDSSIKISKSQIDELTILINKHVNEETYQIFLENNPVFIDPLANKVINKHKLGDDLITDFVVQTLNNNYILVEIEKPQDRIFTIKNDFSATFIHSYGQVLDFLAWVDSNVSYAQTKLPDISTPTGLVIIGCTSDLTPIQKRKLRSFNMNSQRIKIITYDDLISNAYTLYSNIISN